MAKGLKPHTHEDRRRVVEALVKPLSRRFGENLIALAATGSFARGDDGPYSDLELTAFVQTMPEGPRGQGVIIDGLLIEVIWTTRQAWLDMICACPGEEWHLAGSDLLQPVVNAQFIAALLAEAGHASRAQCRELAKRHWHEVQEATGKVLKAAVAEDCDALALVYPDMVRHVLISLAFLNARPFSTFAKMIAEARGFDIRPIEFESMVAALREGYGDPRGLHDLAVAVFEDMEAMLSLAGVDPYDGDLSAFAGPPVR